MTAIRTILMKIQPIPSIIDVHNHSSEPACVDADPLHTSEDNHCCDDDAGRSRLRT